MYQPHYDASYALVIGIDDYQAMTPLNTAVRGARALAHSLEAEHGFTVQLLTDAEATREGILRALNAYRKAERDARLLVYFAGHGVTVEDVNGDESGLLIPYGVGRGAYEQALEMNYFLDQAARFVPAKHVLFLLDVCFGGLAISRADAIEDPVYTDLMTRRGVLAISAGMADQEVADAGPDGYSPFTGLLLDLLARREGFLTGSSLGLYLRDNVARRTRRRQTPDFGRYAGQGGDFVFWHHMRAAELPAEFQAAASGDRFARLGVIPEIERYAGQQPEMAPAARALLEQLAGDDSREVSKAAQAAFDRLAPKPPAADPLAGMEALWEAKDYTQIVKRATQVIETGATNADAWWWRGRARDASNQSHEAIVDCSEAIRLNPQHSRAYRSRGAAKSDLDDHQGAIADYDRAIQIDPKDAVAYYNRGIAKFTLGDQQGAIADFDRAIHIDPNYAMAYLNRGTAKYALGDLARAIVDFDRAIQINPNYSAAYNNRGAAKSDLGDHHEALTDYDHALQIDPNFAGAYKNRGLARQALKGFRGALADFEAYLRLTPGADDRAQVEGWIYDLRRRQ